MMVPLLPCGRRGPGSTTVELSQLRRIWSAEFIPLPADLHVPRGGGLKSALLNSTAVTALGRPLQRRRVLKRKILSPDLVRGSAGAGTVGVLSGASTDSSDS